MQSATSLITIFPMAAGWEFTTMLHTESGESTDDNCRHLAKHTIEDFVRQVYRLINGRAGRNHAHSASSDYGAGNSVGCDLYPYLCPSSIGARGCHFDSPGSELKSHYGRQPYRISCSSIGICIMMAHSE